MGPSYFYVLKSINQFLLNISSRVFYSMCVCITSILTVNAKSSIPRVLELLEFMSAKLSMIQQNRGIRARLLIQVYTTKVASGIMRQSRAPRQIDFRILITYLLAFHTRQKSKKHFGKGRDIYKNPSATRIAIIR